MHEAPPDSASVVIVGGGVAGLVAAVAWAVARPGEPAVLLEQQPHTGGYVTTWRRRRFCFDNTQVVPDLGPVLELLGVELPVHRFARCLEVIRVGGPGGDPFRFSVPVGYEAFETAACERWPRQADRFSRFLAEARSLYRQLEGLKVEPGFWDVVAMFGRARGVIRHGSSTFARWFDRFGIDDADLLEVVAAFVELGGLPAEEVHCLVPISTLCSLLEGACRPAATLDALPEALEARLVAAGGAVWSRSRVTGISVEAGRVAGVKLASGHEIRTERVVTTIDPTVAMGQLVGMDMLAALDARYARKVQRLRMTRSSFNLNLGLEDGTDRSALGPDCGYHVLTRGGDTLKAAFEACEREEIPLAPDRFRLGLVAPHRVVGGAPYLTVRLWPVAPGDWTALRERDGAAYRAEKARVGARIESIVERHLVPGLSERIQFRDLASPATYARYSGSPSGAIYDMASGPDNFARTRLAMRTPVRGLLQPRFVHGVYGAMLSGLHAADALLEGELLSGRAVPPRD